MICSLHGGLQLSHVAQLIFFEYEYEYDVHEKIWKTESGGVLMLICILLCCQMAGAEEKVYRGPAGGGKNCQGKDNTQIQF